MKRLLIAFGVLIILSTTALPALAGPAPDVSCYGCHPPPKPPTRQTREVCEENGGVEGEDQGDQYVTTTWNDLYEITEIRRCRFWFWPGEGWAWHCSPWRIVSKVLVGRCGVVTTSTPIYRGAYTHMDAVVNGVCVGAPADGVLKMRLYLGDDDINGEDTGYNITVVEDQCVNEYENPVRIALRGWGNAQLGVWWHPANGDPEVFIPSQEDGRLGIEEDQNKAYNLIWPQFLWPQIDP